MGRRNKFTAVQQLGMLKRDYGGDGRISRNGFEWVKITHPICESIGKYEKKHYKNFIITCYFLCSYFYKKYHLLIQKYNIYLTNLN